MIEMHVVKDFEVVSMSSYSHAIAVDILTRESDHSLLMWSVALPDCNVKSHKEHLK